EVRRGADGKNAGALPLKQSLGPGGDPVQRIAHHGEIVPARLRDDQTLTLTIEQLDRELRLQRLHLMAHRALRDAQLLRCAREALMPGGGLEGFQSVQRRQMRAHRETSGRSLEKLWQA